MHLSVYVEQRNFFITLARFVYPVHWTRKVFAMLADPTLRDVDALAMSSYNFWLIIWMQMQAKLESDKTYDSLTKSAVAALNCFLELKEVRFLAQESLFCVRLNIIESVSFCATSLYDSGRLAVELVIGTH